MRPDETLSHIPAQSPGLQLATLLPAVQTNKAGPPRASRAVPSRAGTNRPPLTVLKCRLSIFNSRNVFFFFFHPVSHKQSRLACCGELSVVVVASHVQTSCVLRGDVYLNVTEVLPEPCFSL